jgi:hypothetical protein
MPGKGLPIGNLTSQFFANLYLAGLDHYILVHQRPAAYVRCMDDFVLWAVTRAELATMHSAIIAFARNRLALTLKAPVLCATAKGLPFLGFLIQPCGSFNNNATNCTVSNVPQHGCAHHLRLAQKGTATTRPPCSRWQPFVGRTSRPRLRQFCCHPPGKASVPLPASCTPRNWTALHTRELSEEPNPYGPKVPRARQTGGLPGPFPPCPTARPSVAGLVLLLTTPQSRPRSSR